MRAASAIASRGSFDASAGNLPAVPIKFVAKAAYLRRCWTPKYL